MGSEPPHPRPLVTTAPPLRHRRRWQPAAYLYVAPAFLVFVLFLGIPLSQTVQYSFFDRDQLEADLQHLKNLMSAGEIDNATFQAQRDHMLIQARGGPQYGAVFSGDHPNVTGRAKGEPRRPLPFCTRVH